MAVPVHAPRINNNDDLVKVVSLPVPVGIAVARGGVLAQVETDKAIVDVECPDDGYVISQVAQVGDVVAVGSVLLWLGRSADEAAPATAEPASPTALEGSARSGTGPTARARLLLQRHGLAPDAIPISADRLTAEDVERYLAARDSSGTPSIGDASFRQARPAANRPDIDGELHELSGNERGVLRTVTWSRDFAVPGYIEIEYDHGAWESHAAAFSTQHRLMLSPMLALMAWRLVQLASETPRLNSTIVGESRYEYRSVNLGFTVQAEDLLYLAVIRDAAALAEARFVTAIADVQRRAVAHKLAHDELSGATVSFSSMGRWNVSRHVPVLPPFTSLIVAQARSKSGASVLGATYDHRVLSGFQVAKALHQIGKPPTSVDRPESKS